MVLGDPRGVLLLDKPPGFSSTQALARCKRLLAARKAGHTGTLDPFATGLLPLAFGEATKFSRFLIDAPKAYLATLELGVESTTGDPEGELGPRRAADVGADDVDAVLARFVGVQQQVPPMHSAVHVGGKRLYEIAREGREVDRPARTIRIDSLTRLELEGARLVVSVGCSKGTYIRTLAMDIGRALGCGAYLTALRRTGVGPFRLEDAKTMAWLEGAGVEGARSALLPLEVLVASLPRFMADPDAARRFTQGQALRWEGAHPGAEIAIYGPGDAFLGVAACESPGVLAPARLLATAGSTKLPDFA